MGFWAVYMGLYGGGTASVAADPVTGWRSPTHSRVVVSPTTSRVVYSVPQVH